MTTLNKIQVTWSGVKGLPGISTFYSENAVDGLLAALHGFYNDFANNIPSGVVISFPKSGLTIDSTSGQANGSWSTTNTTASITCTGAGSWASPVGCVVNWRTGSYVAGRELRGKTFMVPLIGSQFDQGHLLAASKSEFQASADALVLNGADMRIWSRKTGIVRTVTAATIPDKAVVLRSRRD